MERRASRRRGPEDDRIIDLVSRRATSAQIFEVAVAASKRKLEASQEALKALNVLGEVDESSKFRKYVERDTEGYENMRALRQKHRDHPDEKFGLGAFARGHFAYGALGMARTSISYKEETDMLVERAKERNQ